MDEQDKEFSALGQARIFFTNTKEGDFSASISTYRTLRWMLEVFAPAAADTMILMGDRILIDAEVKLLRTALEALRGHIKSRISNDDDIYFERVGLVSFLTGFIEVLKPQGGVYVTRAV